MTGVIAATGSPLPVNILALTLLLVWCYTGLYLAPRVKGNPLVPSLYRSAVQVASLFAGPLVFLVLTMMDNNQVDKHVGTFVDRIDNIRDKLISFCCGSGVSPVRRD